MKIVIYVDTKYADIFKKSLSPDIQNNKDIRIKFKVNKKNLVIEVEGKSPNKIKGIINSYLTLINVINELV